jgi:hypothetical protein
MPPCAQSASRGGFLNREEIGLRQNNVHATRLTDETPFCFKILHVTLSIQAASATL